MLSISELLSRFRHSLELWIGYLDVYTLQQLQQRPAPDRWSLGQVYQHLISDTNFYVEQMEAAFTTKQHTNEAMNATAAALFASNSFPDQQLENPFNDINLPQPEDKDQLRRELITIREKVQQLFKNATAVSGKTRHPGFEYFSALEWLQFADMHLRHHLRQKERIDASL